MGFLSHSSPTRPRILFLLESAHTASGRLRVLNFLPFIDQERYQIEIRYIPNSIFSHAALFQAAARADVVFLHKKLFRPWEIPFFNERGVLVYDFDDMVMLPGREKYQTIRGKDSNRPQRFQKTVSAARIIIAGNQYLRIQTGQEADKTVIIPTTIDSSDQPIKKVRRQKENLVLGWIGTHGNLCYLEALNAVLRHLANEYTNLSLKIVCDEFIEPAGINTIKKTWRLEDEATDLVNMDIGLMPLCDDLWTQGKCGYKILQYMSAGLPVVASPVGANTAIVRHGVNGFLASTEAEWEIYLKKLLDSPELRRQMGLAGRELVEKEYDLSIWADAFLEVIDQAVACYFPSCSVSR
ncbi:MAG: glycosyltransferase family 4 protein [Deltaproteobacteria bacterium]|nr:glycosyltransferase family 4 protein [Deltaproteobacteria bacterium]